ncbi:MAG TPA: hypothetical protein GXX36_14345 [Clostridiaceae bacterium]|nr:hypothetical protein [Clostridiaceae bacterium]
MMYLCIHFGQFINGKIDTEEKEKAHNKSVDYLYTIQETEFLKEPEKFLEQGLGELEEENMERINLSIADSLINIDKYIEENKEVIGKYLEYIKKDEYLSFYNIVFCHQKSYGNVALFILDFRLLSKILYYLTRVAIIQQN